MPGDLVADYLLAIEADLRIEHGDVVVYAEPCFPVAELARAFVLWLASSPRTTFTFDSMSADPGLVTIELSNERWTVFSAETPQVKSARIGLKEIDRAVAEFVAQVRQQATMHGIEAERIIGS